MGYPLTPSALNRLLSYGVGCPAIAAFAGHLLYQLIMYNCVRTQFEGREDVPWYSPSKRSKAAGTPRIFSAAKYSSVCGIGVRMSNSPVINSVGVFTLPTYIRLE